MNRRSLSVLEFNKIREQLASLCASESGRQTALSLEPSAVLETVRELQEETEEARTVVSEYGGSPVPYFTDVTMQLKLAQIESILSLRGLLDIAQCLRATRTVRGALLTEREDLPSLQRIGKEY